MKLTEPLSAGSSLEDSVIRWCCISHAEQKKCEQWALNINSDPLVCVRALSVRDCIMKIKVRPRFLSGREHLLIPERQPADTAEGRGGRRVTGRNPHLHRREMWPRSRCH